MNFLYLAWLNVTVAIAGSMFFSEILKFPPCTLCWYQRMCMFPLVIILGIGIYKNLKQSIVFAAPFAGIGWLISVYHNLLYYKVIQPSIIPCSSGVSCTEKQLEVFGFITIPLLSLIAFTITSILLFAYYRTEKEKS